MSFMWWIPRYLRRTSLAPLPYKFCIEYCRIHDHNGRMRLKAGVWWMFLLRFLSRPHNRSELAWFGYSPPQVSWRCSSESLTDWTGAVVCVCWYSDTCWRDRKCAYCLSVGSVVLVFQQDPLHHLTPSLHNINKPVRRQIIGLTCLAVGVVRRPFSAVWNLRLVHAVFTMHEMPWHIVLGGINIHFEANACSYRHVPFNSLFNDATRCQFNSESVF
jgi:hypothetical protein